jgi:hypothetical protein
MLGASDWEYIVPYQRDLVAALTGLRRHVFEDGDYISPSEFGLPVPASVDDLVNEEYWEFMGTHGTHSILDTLDVTTPDNTSQEYATIRPLTEDEYVTLFGSTTPSHDAFAELSNSDRLHDYIDGGRGTGRVAILWEDGKPRELAFWGYSGD